MSQDRESLDIWDKMKNIKKYAVEMYKKGEFSFGQTAKFAEISVWDIPSMLKKHKVYLNYDNEEFKKDLKTVKKSLSNKQYDLCSY